MSDGKHTLGKRHIIPPSGAEDGHGWLVQAVGDNDPEGTIVAECDFEGDAILAMVAPELLAALKALVDRDLTYLSGKVMGDQITYEEVKAAREAIKKAEGPTNE